MADLLQIMRSAYFNYENIPERLEYVEAYYRPEIPIPPLVKAAMLGLPSAVKSLLADGVNASLRYCTSPWLSALDTAALMGNLEIVRILLEHGADVNSAGRYGQTVLHTVVTHGRADPDLVDLILSAGADIEARNTNDLTPLHCATQLSSGDAATTLLRRGASFAALDSVESSPLHLAAEHDNLAATRALLAAGADIALRGDHYLMAPLDVAACFGSVEVIRELAWHGVDVNAAAPGIVGFTALHHAAAANRAGAVNTLVRAGASVITQKRHDGGTPLHTAAESINFDAMLALLRLGAPVRRSQDDRVDWWSESPLHTAARRAGRGGAAEVVDLLLRWGADETELDSEDNAVAEVVGVNAAEYNGAAALVGRVHELLSNAPADRAWRRRGLLLLCLARNRTVMGKNSGRGSGGGGAWARGGVFTDDGGDDDSDRDGDSGDAFPWCAGVGVLTTAVAAWRLKHERTPSKVGRRSAMLVYGGGSGDSRGGGGGGGEGDPENGGDWDVAVAMLVEFEHEGFFRTIVGYL